MLVEDDAALALGLKYSMEKEGYVVEVAGTVREGLEKFPAGYGLAVLDLGLPDGTGFELCRAFRALSDLPILFLTACDEETNVVMGLDMGGDEYITKPFRLKELLSRINALLRRSGRAFDGGVRSGGLWLRPEECRLLRGNESIFLTPAECRLAYTLMTNPDRTLTRGQLLSRLWDDGGDFVDENTLSVYIRRLREKIEEDPSNPKLITTVRGVGYRWNLREGGADDGALGDI